MSESALRVDKWLWHARFFKTRTLAAKLCTAGALRVSGSVVSKAHHKVKVGDVLTFPQGREIRVVRVLALSSRRGPAVEAHTLYEDLKPPPLRSGKDAGLPARTPGTGRPTKRDRRALQRLRGGA
jgi:ribosome-associated heat shock protein Hsp15